MFVSPAVTLLNKPEEGLRIAFIKHSRGKAQPEPKVRMDAD